MPPDTDKGKWDVGPVFSVAAIALFVIILALGTWYMMAQIQPLPPTPPPAVRMDG